MSRELDVQIAQKLFGIPLKSDSMEIPCPYYSSSSIHVCEILEALRVRGFTVDIFFDTADGKPNCLCMLDGLKHLGKEDICVAEEESLPLALCKAALEVLG